MSEAKKSAHRLLGCYRTGDAHDPETYISAVVAVLVTFPVSVMREVTDPVGGLPSKLNWLPTVKEIREACDERLRMLTLADRWDAQARRQIEERETLQIAHQRPRKSYEQIVEECRAAGIMIGPKGKTAVDIGEIRNRYGISQEQWNAIPDAK